MYSKLQKKSFNAYGSEEDDDDNDNDESLMSDDNGSNDDDSDSCKLFNFKTNFYKPMNNFSIFFFLYISCLY